MMMMQTTAATAATAAKTGQTDTSRRYVMLLKEWTHTHTHTRVPDQRTTSLHFTTHQVINTEGETSEASWSVFEMHLLLML